MSLNYELGKIKDWKTVTRATAEHDDPGRGYKKGDEIMSPVTNTLIWCTLGIGMGEITEENVYEFYGRLRIQEALNGAYLRYHEEGGGIRDEYITLEQVKAHIGLTTNVFPKRTHSEFLKQVITAVARKDGMEKPLAWTDDYQKLVQYGRLLVDQSYDDYGRFKPQEKIINRMANELPRSETYPRLDPKGVEQFDCEECGETFPDSELKDGICPKCEAEYQSSLTEGVPA